MVTLAYINIWGQRAGIVMWNENTESAVFEYDGQNRKMETVPSI